MTPTDLITYWRTKADDYLRASKAYQCRANSEARAGYVKGAAVLRMCADHLEKALAEEPTPRRRSQRASQGLSQAVLDGSLEGDKGATTKEGATVQDVREGQQDHGSDGL